MAVGKKPDFPPLLAPGRHVMSFEQLKLICRDNFPNSQRRRHLFQKFEEFIQEYLVSGIIADVWVNGSFLTKKDAPSDVDVAVIIEADVVDTLTDDQRNLIEKTNDAFFDPDVNAFAFTWLPKGHEDYNDEGRNPALTWHEQFGVENSCEWLKGFCVLKLRESDVGLRLCSR